MDAAVTLTMENNSASNGGGLALLELARLMVAPSECPTECFQLFNDSKCAPSGPASRIGQGFSPGLSLALTLSLSLSLRLSMSLTRGRGEFGGEGESKREKEHAEAVWVDDVVKGTEGHGDR